MGMIIYNVTVSIDAAAEEEWVNWMRSIHIPEVMATGKFIESKMSRILAEEEGGKAYSIQYSCKDMETLELYQQEDAPALQQKHAVLFGDKAVAFRTLMNVVHIENNNG
jgi:hypothetical protein